MMVGIRRLAYASVVHPVFLYGMILVGDPIFGHCAYFVIVDSDTCEFESINNAAAKLGGSAGIQAAQLSAAYPLQRAESLF